MFWILVFSHRFFFDQRFLPTDLIGGPLGAAFFDNSILFLLGTVESDWCLFQFKKDSKITSLNKKVLFFHHTSFHHPSMQILCFIIIQHPSMDSFKKENLCSTKFTKRSWHQAARPSECWRFQRLAEVVGDAGVLGVEKSWRFLFLEKKARRNTGWKFGNSFVPSFFWKQPWQFIIKFQSCQLNLLRAEIQKSSWSFVIDKTCRKECFIFHIDVPY